MKKSFRSPEEKMAWEKAERLDEIHWMDLRARGVVEGMAQTYIKRWVAKGWLKQVRIVGHRKIYGHVDRDVVKVIPGQEKTPETAMWKVMRRSTTFTPLDLQAMAKVGGHEIKLAAARAYCRQLLAAGYLKTMEPAIHGKREATYSLIKRTGLRAPMPRKVTGILDPNTREFVPNLREQGQ